MMATLFPPPDCAVTRVSTPYRSREGQKHRDSHCIIHITARRVLHRCQDPVTRYPISPKMRALCMGNTSNDALLALGDLHEPHSPTPADANYGDASQHNRHSSCDLDPPERMRLSSLYPIGFMRKSGCRSSPASLPYIEHFGLDRREAAIIRPSVTKQVALTLILWLM